MLDLKPSNLLEEIESAERLRDAVIHASRDMVSDYIGRYYRNDKVPGEPVPENHAFEWLATITPSIIYDNPRASVTSRISGLDPELLLRMQHGVNRWARDVELWRTLMRVWHDMAFSFGVIQTTISPIPYAPGHAGMLPMRPVARRISPQRFFMDARCEDISEARFQGHLWKRDYDDVLNDPRFNKDAVKSLMADMELNRAGDAAQESGPDRKELICYEVWVPEQQLTDEPGYHGSLWTLGLNRPQEGSAGKEPPQWIREPRPFFGPSTGPYTMFGVYVVPGQPYPLSPLAATHEQVKELNAHATAAARSASAFKSFIGFEPANQEAGNAAKNAGNGEVVAIPGIADNSVRELQTGGVKKEQYEYIAMLRERRDRMTGMTDAARGIVTGVGTATENAEAAESRGNREAMIRRMYANSTTQVLTSSAWYMWHSEFVVFPLGPEAAKELNPRPPQLPPEGDAERISVEYGLPILEVKRALTWNPSAEFRGGIDGDFSALMLEIEPYSMERVNEAMMQRRNLEWLKLFMEAAPLMVQFPYINWTGLMDNVGQTINQRNAGELIHSDMLMQMQQMMTAMQQGAPGAPSGPGASSSAPMSAGEPNSMAKARSIGASLGHAVQQR